MAGTMCVLSLRELILVQIEPDYGVAMSIISEPVYELVLEALIKVSKGDG